MLRRIKKPLRRVVFGGSKSADLVIELTNRGVALKPKGERRSRQAHITWNQLYKLATAERELLPIGSGDT